MQQPAAWIATGRSAATWERWRWALPVLLVAAAVAVASPANATAALGAGIGLVFVVWVARHPVGAVQLLLVAVLYNLAGLALLYRLGVPAEAVKAISFWKEAILVGLALAVLRREGLRRPDGLEWAALAYVALGCVYFALPGLLVGQAAGAHLSTFDRALGWRGDVLYVLVFVVVRRLRLTPDVVDRMLDRFLGAAVVLAAFGLFEAAAPSLFNQLAVSVLGIPRYEHDLVGYQAGSAFDLHSVLVYSAPMHQGVLRIGSLLVDYLAVGFVFAVGAGIAADRLARDPDRRRLWAALVVLLLAAFLTETRSAVIASVVAVAFALRRRPGKPLWARARLARWLAAGMLVLVPVALATGLLGRFVHAPTSNGIHQAALRGGLDSLERAPLGNGLATAEGGAQILLAGTGLSVVTEDQYLQIGAVMGIPGLALYLVVFGGTIRCLVRRGGADLDDVAPSAISNAAVGCAVGIIFTQAFTNLELATAFFTLAGLAVGVVDRREDEVRLAAAPGPPGTGRLDLLPPAGADR